MTVPFAVALSLVAWQSATSAPPVAKAEQFQDAARKGDAEAVKKLLDEGVDVNTRFRYDATALFYACDHGHLEVVKVLLERGADMSIKDTFYGFTPLALATGPAQKKKPEHFEIAKLLIQKGAPGKETALTDASESGDTALAQVDPGHGWRWARRPVGGARAREGGEAGGHSGDAGGGGCEAVPGLRHRSRRRSPHSSARTGSQRERATIAPAGARVTLGAAARPRSGSHWCRRRPGFEGDRAAGDDHVRDD